MFDRIQSYTAQHIRRVIAVFPRHPRVTGLVGRNSKQKHDHVNDQIADKVNNVYIAHLVF
jgi:hypothetical protein